MSTLRAVLAHFDTLYPVLNTSPTWRRTWLSTFGWPAWAQLGLIDVTDLHTIAKLLQLRPGQRIVDLAGGAGDVGFWLQNTTNATVLSLDASGAGARIAHTLGVRSVQGSIAALPLRPASAQGVICIDGFGMTFGLLAKHAATILQRGGRLVWLANREHSTLASTEDELLAAGLSPVFINDQRDPAVPLLDRWLDRLKRERTVLEQEIPASVIRPLVREMQDLRDALDNRIVVRLLVAATKP